MILNDDLKLDSNVFKESIPLLIANENLFAVTAKIFNWDGQGVQNGIRRFFIRNGWAVNFWDFDDIKEIRYTFYASGGAALFNTEKIKQLKTQKRD